MGLARRRHFAVEGRTLLGIEDELFGERPPRRRPRRRAVETSIDRAAAPRLQHADRLDRARPHRHVGRHRRHDPGRAGRDHPLAAGGRARRAGWAGHGQDGRGAPPRRLPALHAPLPARRPGRAGDRAQPGLPALHRAGAAVAGRGGRRAGGARRPRPRRALRRSWRPGRHAAGGADQGRRPHERRDRQRGRATANVRFARTWSCRSDRGTCGSRADDTVRIVKQARRRFRRHNAARRWVEGEVWSAMAATWRGGDDVSARARFATRCGRCPEIALGARPHVAGADAGPAAARPVRIDWRCCGWRPTACSRTSSTRRSTARGAESVDDVRWTAADVALLDDAREVLGPQPSKSGKPNDADEIRTYGHIVIDEVQDLTPMQLKMATRRSLNGSMTVVGDIAQATGALAPDGWDEVLAHLPEQEAEPGDRSVGRLSHPRPDHGARQSSDGGRHARPAGADVGARRRCRAADRACRLAGRRRLAEVRDAPAATLPSGSVAVVAPDERCDEISDASALPASTTGGRRPPGSTSR